MQTQTFKIENGVVRQIKLPLIKPFSSSLGTVVDREVLLVEVACEGKSGWGEAPVMPWPFYTSETIETAWYAIRNVLMPILFRTMPQTPSELHAAFEPVCGHRMARAAVESAYWDLFAKLSGQPLYRMLGGVRNSIDAGVVVSLSNSGDEIVDQVAAYVDQGYLRVKIKAAPGQTIAPLTKIRRRFHSLPLLVDANCSYSLANIDELRALDDFDLTMIEQPFGARDFIGHATLQRVIKTPICLDESIECLDDLKLAIELKSCQVVSIKPSRVGGLSEAIKIHNLAREHGIGVWCGGMLETGIGRASCMALASLPNFIFPADLSASSRYFHKDIIEPAIELDRDGTLRLSEEPGIGVEINQKMLERSTITSDVCTAL